MKRYLFTGSSGIAESAARLAVAMGAAVFLIGNEEQQCRDLCQTLPNCAFAIADVADAQQVNAAVEQAFAAMGVDGLFHVAGLSGRSFGDGPLHECTPSAWEQMLAVHAGGTFHINQAVITRWLMRSHPGAIVNMSSVLA